MYEPVTSCLIIQDHTDRYFIAYLLPNEESENDRLDMLHEMCFQLLHRKLYLAPIKSPQRVIDLATGRGIWAIDFGKFACRVLSTQATMLTLRCGPAP